MDAAAGTLYPGAMSLLSRLFGKKSAPPAPPAPPAEPEVAAADVARAFVELTVGVHTFSVLCVGDLAVPTGRIVACDMLVFPETRPFVRTVTPGTYQVELAIARVSDSDERCAAARLVINDRPTVRWEPALIDGDPPLGPGRVPIYGVDTGLGSFMDVACRDTLLVAMAPARIKVSYYDDLLYKELDRKRPTVDWTLHVPDPASPHNVAIFSSGWGDGGYVTHVGLDADDRVTCFMTDFQIVEP